MVNQQPDDYIYRLVYNLVIANATYRKQQKFHGTKLSRFSWIFNKTRKFSLHFDKIQ